MRAANQKIPRLTSRLQTSRVDVTSTDLRPRAIATTNDNMPTAVELSLSSLVPTLSPIPDDLTNLATSLLAQSRSKAATLKPEEEIGRTYACCHIACQRLGHRLALEIAKPAPPVKPRVYTKLHTYLNSVLKTTTPRRAARVDVDRTPRKVGMSTPGDQLRESLKAAATPNSRRQGGQGTEITTPASRKRKADMIEQERPVSVSKGRTDVADQVYRDENTKDVFDEPDNEDDEDNITAAAKLPAKTPLRRKEKHGTADVDEIGAAGLLPGLGTMFQPAVDWLSDERRADYARWKRSILREVAMVEGTA